MEHYPEARYYFLENEIHPDHSVTVTCEVQIGDVKRVMWLPVMDHRNRAIENPDARQISDAKMRCLVKCLGIFGLGLSLYAGSDLPMHEPDEKPKAKPQPKAEPKPEPKPEEPAQAKEANKDNTDHIDTPEGAFAVVSHTLEIAKEFCESKAELREFYIKNRNVASVLETKFPEQHKRLMDGYQEISKQFEE